MNNLVEDLSKLTTIPESVLNKLVEKIFYCISDVIEETVIEQKKIAEIDIKIGTIYIELNLNNVRYKFIPSKEFETIVKDTVINKKNLLQDVLEKTIVNRITNTYKDLL